MGSPFSSMIRPRTRIVSAYNLTSYPPLQSFLGVPLFHEGRTIGLIGPNREGGYRQEDLQTIEALSHSITQALMTQAGRSRNPHVKQRA